MDKRSEKLVVAEEKIRILKSKLKAVRETDWAKEKAELEARIRGLENENASLREDGSDSDGKVDKGKIGRLSGFPKTGDDETKGDTVTLPKYEIEEAKQRYNKLVAQLETKRLEYEELTSRLPLQDQQRILDIEADETKILQHWQALQAAVRELCKSHLNNPGAQKVEDAVALKELAALSKNSTLYLAVGASNEPHLLFQAAIWRHLHHRFFERATRSWGEVVHQQFKALGLAFQGSGRVTEKDFEAWRIHTGRLLGISLPLDDEAIETQATKMQMALTKFMNGNTAVEDVMLWEPLRQIGGIAAELSAIFARSRVLPLMSNHPSNQEPHGFPFHPGTMEKMAQCGHGEIVGMMISPILVNRDQKGEFQLLSKAFVVVGDTA
ncbi:hypothetical protein SCAR479_02345 [Seiridium cardinale]|uniref:Uncharacterized protein n=1 Tax=Seiridium cardinale TaxID=138064 RepID=A0ABR2X5T4_9PEZI